MHRRRGEVDSVGRERRPILTWASRAGRSEERRAELSTPVGRAGILGTEHLKQVDEFLAVVVVELHGGQQRGKRFFDIVHRLAAGSSERTKVAGGRALGDLVKQRKTLVDLPLFNELSGKGGEHIRVVGLEGVGLVERGNIADFEQPLYLVLLLGGRQLLDELAYLCLTLGTHEPVDNLAVDHGVHGRDRLDPEGLSDRRVGVNVDLGKLNGTVGLADHLVEDRTECLARTAPLSPEINDHRDLVGPLDDIGFERCISYISHRDAQRSGGFSNSRAAVYGVIEEEPVARPARPEDLYTLHGSPSLQDPVLLIHLTGWIDAGLCAREATETILGQIAPVIVAEFETEWLLDHRARRPTMHIVEGVNVGLDWPEITLVSGRDATGNDVLVLHGAEPDHNWRSFCDAVVSLSQRFGVRRVIGLGSYPASSPHTRPSRLSVTAATPDLASLGFTPATLDVPAGMQAALEMAHHAAGIESVGLWAQVPHYISGAHYPAASLALVDGLVGAAGVVLDSSQLAADALATRNRLDDLVDDDSSHRDMLAALEKQYDDLVEAEAEIATSNDLTDELEAFLRSQNDDD